MPSRTFFNVDDQQANLKALQAAGGLCNDTAFKLALSGIAPLTDEASIAQLIGISPQIIFSAIINQKKHYRVFNLSHPSGKVREIAAPRTYLKVIQWWILDNILNKIHLSPSVMGFVAGRGIFDNALHHIGSAHILNLDMKNFFPSIKTPKVYKIFLDLGYNHVVADQLSKLCTFNGELPQGAPTSPALANLAARDLDEANFIMAQEYQLKYTRYADDITLSSNNWIDVAIADQIASNMEAFGFRENRDKRRFFGRSQRQVVTGLVTNEKVNMPREWRKRTRALFYQAIKDPLFARSRYNELVGRVGLLTAIKTPLDNSLIVEGRKAIVVARSVQ